MVFGKCVTIINRSCDFWVYIFTQHGEKQSSVLLSFVKALGSRCIGKVLAGDTTQKPNELMETKVKSSHCEALLTSSSALPFIFACILVCRMPSKGRLLISGRRLCSVVISFHATIVWLTLCSVMSAVQSKWKARFQHKKSLCYRESVFWNGLMREQKHCTRCSWTRRSKALAQQQAQAVWEGWGGDGGWTGGWYHGGDTLKTCLLVNNCKNIMLNNVF